jgi:hydrogenase expression/formation protein HypE
MEDSKFATIHKFTKTSCMNNTILLGHGSGGMMSDELIRNVFLKNFSNPSLDVLSDAALLSLAGQGRIAFTTDSFVVDPIFFPGGDIGKLSICGTVNDLSVSGATPLYISAAFIIEEGFPVHELETIACSMAAEAQKAGVQIVTGDTKVVKRGQCDKVFINTAGIGRVDTRFENIAGGSGIRTGDRVLVNGYLGDHEMAILAARENLEFDETLLSDAACLNHMIKAMLDENLEIHFMRDVTRGGIGTILSEIAVASGLCIEATEENLPVKEQVKGMCEIYGFNPLYLANEGKVAIVIAENHAERALEIMRSFDTGMHACAIGSVTEKKPGRVLLHTITGSTRIIDKLAGEQLPRIC